MSVKTVASYTCAIFSVVVLILCLCTNYWIEYEVIDRTVIGKDRRYRVRAGLWEYCQRVKEITDKDFGALKCTAVDKLEGTGLKTAKRDAIFAMYLLAMLATLVAFIFVTVYCITDKYFFPVTRSAILFFLSAIFVVIGLAIYTDNYMNKKVQFSWSYGAGWSATAMYIISVILLFADK